MCWHKHRDARCQSKRSVETAALAHTLATVTLLLLKWLGVPTWIKDSMRDCCTSPSAFSFSISCARAGQGSSTGRLEAKGLLSGRAAGAGKHTGAAADAALLQLVWHSKQTRTPNKNTRTHLQRVLQIGLQVCKQLVAALKAAGGECH